MYSPTLGRFMQTDPIGYGDGMNMYGYVGGDPVNNVDPMGMCDFNTGISTSQDISERDRCANEFQSLCYSMPDLPGDGAGGRGDRVPGRVL